MEDMDIKVFFEKQKKWATWEEKEKDLTPYLSKIVAKLKCEKPDPFVKKEIDLLKAIVDELEHDHAEVLEKMKVLEEAYFSPLKEIYKMPGCIEELEELLKSHPTIGTYETDMITQQWYKHYSHDMRERVKKSSTPEQNIIQREEFLTRKCVEIDKARAKMYQLDPEILKVFDLLRTAKLSLFLASKVPADNKYESSSSREKSLSRSESSESSSRSESSESSSRSESSSPKDKEEQKNKSVSSSREESPSLRDKKRARK